MNSDFDFLEFVSDQKNQFEKYVLPPRNRFSEQGSEEAYRIYNQMGAIDSDVVALGKLEKVKEWLEEEKMKEGTKPLISIRKDLEFLENWGLCYNFE